MDVRCERCSTEYEFDDALVSGRGTTVKCTNCGHKFKIRRSDGDFSEDFWNVQTGDGRTLVFTSLRELQRAIQTNLVDRNDLLSRGGLKQKPIGQIPELAPFFEQRDQRRSLPPPPGPAATAPPTAAATAAAQPGAAATASAVKTRSSRPPPPPGPSAPPLAPPPRQRMSTRPDFPPAPSSLDWPLAPPERVETSDRPPARVGHKTLIGTGSDDGIVLPPLPPPAAAAGPANEPPGPLDATPAMRERLARPRSSEAPPPTEREVEPDTQRFVPEQAAAPAAAAGGPTGTMRPLTSTQPIDPVFVPRNPVPTPPPPPFEASSPLPPPAQPALRAMNLDQDEYSDGMRGRAPSLSDAPASMGRRRSVGGYLVAFVVVAGIGLIGAIWAKGHLGGLLGGRPQPVVVTDPRVANLLASGEKALADGSLESAKESFDKASALAEKDPRVLLDLARLAAVRADVPWLKSRLLAADATDENRLTKDELTERSAAARKAADDALAVAPDDPAALRAKIDALRISGDRDGARALVARVATPASQPETAYVLATLDLADNEPLWSTVIERLRVAASAESGPGRARASLAYALARSGDVIGAKSEVERLAAMSRPHVLLPLLRAFADRAKQAPARVEAMDAGPVVAVRGVDGGRVRDPADKKLPSDSRQLVTQGEAARNKGDFDRAQMLFAAALDRNPNDTEALNGLAAIAHSRRDLNGARASYKRVLSINPSYVPALVGVGDVDWESGDRASAMKTYKEVVDRFPEGSYPARVKQRAEGSSGGGVGGGTAPTAPPTAAPTPPPTAPTPTPADTGGGG